MGEYDPIEFKKEINYYRCPKCSKEDQYERSIKEHIIEAHEYPDWEKKVKKNYGDRVEFSSKEEAEGFCKVYNRYLSLKYGYFDNQHTVAVEWDGAGKYDAYREKKEHGYYESTTENIITFKRWKY